jgi:quinol-cytochrome oxidoreductase complex cytochrome b subunit
MPARHHRFNASAYGWLRAIVGCLLAFVVLAVAAFIALNVMGYLTAGVMLGLIGAGLIALIAVGSLVLFLATRSFGAALSTQPVSSKP